MKRLIALFLSTAMIFGVFTSAAFAAEGVIDDDIANTSKMYSSSENLIFETKTLGSYADANYATSNKDDTMEFVYNLDGIASFEIVTLNYRQAEDISLSVCSKADGEYSPITAYNTKRDSLDEKNNWEKITYTGTVSGDANYFKIVINQSQKSKYIRLDNVKLMVKIDLNIQSTAFSASGEKITGRNIEGANELTIKFNQPISEMSDLTVLCDGEVVQSVGAKTGGASDEAVYELDSLGFDIYEFKADFKAVSGEKCSLDMSSGAKVIYYMPDTVHFGEVYDGYIEKCIDSDGNEYSADDVLIKSSNEDVISFENGIPNFKNPGTSEITASFTFGGESASEKREITLCGAESLLINPSSVRMNAGEKKTIEISVVLSDKTVAKLTSFKAVSADSTIANVDGDVLEAVSGGTTFINITADYYGNELSGIISVGVGKEPLEAVSYATLGVNRTSLIVGESIWGVVNCFSNSGRMDLISVDKTYYSDNTSVITVSDDGKMTAVGEGTAQVYALVRVGGAEVTTNSVTVSVSEDSISKAEIIVPSCFMNVSDEYDISACAFTKLGEKIDDFKIKYTVKGSAVKISGGKLKAIAAGEAQISMTASYGGADVSAQPVTITVSENAASSGKDFYSDGNTSGDNVVDCSSDLFAEKGTGLMTRIDKETKPNQYVTIKCDEEIKRVKLTAYYLNDFLEDDLQLFVSEDGENFTRVPHNKISVEQKIDSGAWYNLYLTYDKEMLSGVRYIRALIARSAENGNHAQGIRLWSISAEHDNKPTVTGIGATDKNGAQTNSAKAANISVSFSCNVEGGEVILKSASGETKCEGSLTGSIYTAPVKNLKPGEYTLAISGFKNEWGSEMEPTEQKIYIKSASGRCQVSDIKVNGKEVSADILCGAEDSINPVIITQAFAENGDPAGIFIDTGTYLSKGSNSYICPHDFENVYSAKVFVWRGLSELCIY